MSGFKGYPPAVQVLMPVPDIFVAVNSDQEEIRNNIKHSISLGLRQVIPHETQWNREICLVTGGPSLKDTFHLVEILERVDFDHSEGCDHDDRCQNRNGQEIEQRCQHDERQHDDECRENVRQSCFLAGLLANSRSGETARNREALEDGADHIGGTYGKKLLVWSDGVFVPGGKDLAQRYDVGELDECQHEGGRK